MTVAGAWGARPWTRGRVALWTGGVTGLLVLAALRHGLALGPDAWTYWTASASWLAGDGYVDGHGLPVLEWPPLYSLWLAAVQSLTGVSIAGARLAQALAAGVSAALLTLWLLRRTDQGSGSPRWPVAVFVAASVTAQTRGLGAESLQLVWLGAMLVALGHMRTAASTQHFWGAIAGAAVSGVAVVLTRHVGFAFVVAAVAVVLLLPRRTWRARVVGVLAVGGAALGAWWSVRQALDQTASHGWVGSQRDLLPTAYYMLEHVGRGLAPWPIGVGMFVGLAWWLGSTRAGAHRQLAAIGFVGVALLAILAMFALVPVGDPPGERFVGWAACLVGGLGVGAARHVLQRRWRHFALGLLLLAPVVRASRLVVWGRTGHTTVDAHGGEVFLAPTATVDWRRPVGTVLEDGRTVVAVPLFAWQQERLAAGEGRR